MKHDAAEILQRLYDSGINCIYEHYYPIEFTFVLKNNCEIFKGSTYQEALEKLISAALEYDPDSEFAVWWRENESR